MKVLCPTRGAIARLFRDCGKLFLNLLLTVAAGCVLLAAVYSIPTDSIHKHVAASGKNFEETYPHFIPGMLGGQLDYFTDALMLLTAECPVNELPHKAALRNARGGTYGKNPTELFPVLTITLYPLIWFLTAPNHSYQSAQIFMYRTLGIMVYAFVMLDIKYKMIDDALNDEARKN